LKGNCFVTLFLFIALKGFSQFELPMKSISIAPISNSSGIVTPTSSIKYPSIFDKKDKLLENFSLITKKVEPEKSVMDTQTEFINPGDKIVEKENQKLKTEGLSSVVDNSDSFLGEFIVTTVKLKITCRDYGAIDGDVVSINLNGQLVVPVINLESGFKSYVFELNDGSNEIHIEALNTGMLFPNTGQFVFYDGNEKLVTNQQWNLNAGYKAIIKIRKIKGLTEKE
jgi:hypothetical protein